MRAFLLLGLAALLALPSAGAIDAHTFLASGNMQITESADGRTTTSDATVVILLQGWVDNGYLLRMAGTHPCACGAPTPVNSNNQFSASEGSPETGWHRSAPSTDASGCAGPRTVDIGPLGPATRYHETYVAACPDGSTFTLTYDATLAFTGGGTRI